MVTDADASSAVGGGAARAVRAGGSIRVMRWTARWLGRMGIVSAACALIGAGGCAAPRDTTFRSPPGRYAEAFEAARASLREAGFEVERADARLGVITTAPLHEAGLFTPWAGIGDSVGEAWEDTLNDRWRRAEIRRRRAPGTCGRVWAP